MTETVVLCGNFATIVNSYFLLGYIRVAVSIPVTKLHRIYSHFCGIPAKKWESRIPIILDADL